MCRFLWNIIAQITKKIFEILFPEKTNKKPDAAEVKRKNLSKNPDNFSID